MVFIISTLAYRLNHLNIGTYQIFSFTTLILATEFPRILNIASFIDFMFDRIKTYRCFKEPKFYQRFKQKGDDYNCITDWFRTKQLFIKNIFLHCS